MFGFAEKLIAQNCVNLTENCVPKMYGCLDLQRN